MPIQDIWKRIYGGYGYSSDYMRQRMAEQEEYAQGQYQQGVKAGVANLAQRGFYSTRPVGHMIGQLGAAKARALTGYRRGLEMESAELAERQRGALFGAMTQEEMAKQGQAYALERMSVEQQNILTRMDQQQKYDLVKMAKQYEYDRDLMKLQKELNKRGWGSLLGTIVGTFAGAVTGGLGTNVANRLFPGD